MIPRTPHSSSARLSDPLSRSPATESSAISVHLGVRAVLIRTVKSQCLDTSENLAHFLDTATHSIDTYPNSASNSSRGAACLRQAGIAAPHLGKIADIGSDAFLIQPESLPRDLSHFVPRPKFTLTQQLLCNTKCL